ncbi:hypothetical protein KSP40_PGU009937 [Platanthera guangdongensis]|uniref:Isopenicillin N synthase-like Fe(2+) 2OG dioxygenase domain-containing protein n=1 Tax=Platanthera guangdongensis TaxID=2320717 RepID=A0ABR2LEW1_9ASPA
MGIYGCGAHSDYGLITLLATDDVVGLQVTWEIVICKDKDARPQIWEFVPPLKGCELTEEDRTLNTLIG